MCKGETQGSVAAHGDAADGASGTSGEDAVFGFDVRQEFLKKEVAVAHRAVDGVDVEAAFGLGCDDEVVGHLVLAAEIVEHGPAAAVEQGSFVVAQAVKKVEHRITLCRMLGCARIVSGGQV